MHKIIHLLARGALIISLGWLGRPSLVQAVSTNRPESAQADLQISMTSTPAIPVVGGTITYAIQVRNLSTTTAIHPHMILSWDRRSVGVGGPIVFTPARSVGWTCSVSDIAMTADCSRAALLGGTTDTLSFSINIIGYVRATANSATISADTEDPDTGNNHVESTIFIDPPSATTADLQIERSSYSPVGPFPPGSLVQQRLSAQEIVGTSTRFTATYQAAPGFQMAGAYGIVGGDCTSNPVEARCVGEIAATGNMYGVHAYSLAPTTPGTYTHTFNIAGSVPDPNPANNSGSISMTVAAIGGAQADLYIAASVAPTVVQPGALVSYTLVVTNSGPDPASNVTVIVPLEVARRSETLGRTGYNLVVHAEDWTCNSAYGHLWECIRPTLAAGESSRIVMPFSAPIVPGVYTDQPVVGSGTADPDTTNNVGAVSLTVNNMITPLARYRMSAVAYAGAPLARASDSEVLFTFSTTNEGPDVATEAYALITFYEMTYIRHSAPPGWACTVLTRYMECRKASVGVGNEDWSVTTRMPIVGATRAIKLCAYVNSATADTGAIFGYGGPGCAHATVSSHIADLQLGLRDFPDPVNAGGLITYTMDVTNAGPGVNTGVFNLTTQFTPTLAIASVTAPGWYVYPSGTGQWSMYGGQLSAPAGVGARVTFVALAPAITGVVTNTTTIWGTELESDYDNNTRTATTTVMLGALTADLSVSQFTVGEPICPSAPFVFTATVANAGPEIATHPIITIALPTGATFVRADGPWACTSDGTGRVRCGGGSLAVGATARFVVSATAPGTPGVTSVTASVGADESDFNRDDNLHRLPVTISAACTTGMNIDWYTVDDGGVTFASGGTVMLGGTAGQPDAGSHAGGSVSLSGGFWNSLRPSFRISLPMVER